MTANPLVLDDIDAVRNWAARARPVFICGQERSGTSALLLALARHPALFPVADVFDTFVINEPQQLLTAPARPTLQAYLGGAPALERLKAQLAAWSRGGDAWTPEDLVRTFFAFAAGHVYAGRRPLEKTPSHVFSLPRLFRAFPQALVLACVREPVDVADSYRRRLAREQSAGKPASDWAWLVKSDPQLIQQFRRVDRALREAATQVAPGRIFLVPYAWLTADPRAALAQLCQFLGEPFDEAMLTPQAAAGRLRVDERLNQPLGAGGVVDVPSHREADAVLRRETWGLAARWRRPGVIPPDADAGARAGAGAVP